jgi:hypothetical protein
MTPPYKHISYRIQALWAKRPGKQRRPMNRRKDSNEGQTGNEIPKPRKEKENLSDAKPASKTSHTFFIQPLDTDGKKKFSHMYLRQFSQIIRIAPKTTVH